jgi:hypothetical protein
VKKVWKAPHFTMHILKRELLTLKEEEGKKKRRERKRGQICIITRMKTLAQCRKIVCICVLFKVYTGEWAWKAVGHILQRPCYPT